MAPVGGCSFWGLPRGEPAACLAKNVYGFESIVSLSAVYIRGFGQKRVQQTAACHPPKCVKSKILSHWRNSNG